MKHLSRNSKFSLFLASLYFHEKLQNNFNKDYPQTQKVQCFNDLQQNFQNLLYQKKTDIFIWGRGKVINSSDYMNFHPHKIRSFQTREGDQPREIIDITFGEFITAAIDKNNDVFAWKEPKLNSEKDDSIDNHVRKDVIQLTKGLKIIQTGVTKDKIFMLSKDGRVFFYNYSVIQQKNDNYFFTVKHEEHDFEIQKDKMIQVKELKNIVSIATGKDHIIALDNKGVLYGMGDDSYGQLGLDKFNEERINQMKTFSNFIMRRERKPQIIPVIEPVKKVVCGLNHTLVLSVTGNVYGFGNNKYEQLSNDTEYRQGIIGINKPTLIKNEKFSGFEIVDIAASGNCSFIIGYDKKNLSYSFFSAGEGLRGTLGQNLIKHISDIDIMPDISGLINSNNLKPFEPVKLSCGEKHCLLLFKNPRVLYVWGNNEDGELGTKDRCFYESPFPMLEEYMLPNKIINISAGYTNSAFIAEKIDKKTKNEILQRDQKIYEEEMEKRKSKRKSKKTVKKENSPNDEENKNNEKSLGFLEKLKNTIKKYL